ncbi:MAG TPA: hypothetical protein VM432_07715, partial [Bdellovibrionales bacterium]|nr:hypothetical protein [Bdellovibrionales bacterium]
PRIPGIENHHIFRIGKLTLVGLAVGNSRFNSVEQLATERGLNLSRSERSCTWYMNDGNRDARANFVWRYVERPSSNAEKTVAEYESVLQASIDQEAVNWVSCAEDHGYLAMGCDGMRHRGPTVFAMFLAFAGCNPENSVKIANSFWGLNGVSEKSRLAVAKKGYELGEQRPLSRKRLQAIMQ